MKPAKFGYPLSDSHQGNEDYEMKTTLRFWLVAGIVLAMTVAGLSPALAQDDAPEYPLAGEVYEAVDVDGDLAPDYNMVWDDHGWLWMPTLPTAADRKFSAVSITIEEGDYLFYGVECWMKWDLDRDGEFDPPPTEWPEEDPNAWDPNTRVGRGNTLPFTIDTEDGEQAWALISCNAGPASGASVVWVPEGFDDDDSTAAVGHLGPVDKNTGTKIK